jgi:hypothetical protein
MREQTELGESNFATVSKQKVQPKKISIQKDFNLSQLNVFKRAARAALSLSGDRSITCYAVYTLAPHQLQNRAR